MMIANTSQMAAQRRFPSQRLAQAQVWRLDRVAGVMGIMLAARRAQLREEHLVREARRQPPN
jgi:hypothetical protein